MISTDIPGVKITINIENQDLAEHIIPGLDHALRTTDRLVEAQSGKVFAIHLEANNTADLQGNALAFRVFVDGRYVETHLISKDWIVAAGSWAEKSEGRFSDRDQVQKYYFKDVVIVAENTTSITSRSRSVRSAIERASSSSAGPGAQLSGASSYGLPTPASSMSSMTSRPSRGSESMLTPSLSSSGYNSAPRAYDPAPPMMPGYSADELSELGTIKIVVSYTNHGGAVDLRLKILESH